MVIGDTWILTILAASTGLRQGLLDNTVILKLLRLGRLVRLCRMIEVFQTLPDLMILIKGMGVAIRAVTSCLIWMFFIIYVFAIAFRQLTDQTALGKLRFKSMPATIRYLLLSGIVPDVADNANEIWDMGGFFAALLYLFFAMVVTITVLNMLTGVLVGVVQTTAEVEKEELVIGFVKQTVMTSLSQSGADTDNNGMISKDEFAILMNDKATVKSFDQLGVDVVGLCDLGEHIFADDRELPIQAFMELLMELRGNNHATVKDIVDLRRFVQVELNRQQAELEELLDSMHGVEKEYKSRTSSPKKSKHGFFDDMLFNLPTAVPQKRNSVDDIEKLDSIKSHGDNKLHGERQTSGESKRHVTLAHGASQDSMVAFGNLSSLQDLHHHKDHPHHEKDQKKTVAAANSALPSMNKMKTDKARS